VLNDHCHRVTTQLQLINIIIIIIIIIIYDPFYFQVTQKDLRSSLTMAATAETCKSQYIE
jgi:hypothetical protein